MWQTREGTPEKEKKRGNFSSCLWRRWRANVAVLCVFCFGSANATAIAPSTLMVRRASVQHNKWISNSNSGTIISVVSLVVISNDVHRERRPAFTDTAQTGSELGGTAQPSGERWWLSRVSDNSNRGGALLRRPRWTSVTGEVT